MPGQLLQESTIRLQTYAAVILLCLGAALGLLGATSSPSADGGQATEAFPSLPWAEGETWTYQRAPHCEDCPLLGIDFDASGGSSTGVRSIGNGVVLRVTDNLPDRTIQTCTGHVTSNAVVVRSQVLRVIYAHIKAGSVPPAIAPGAVVRTGQLLGQLGAGGCTYPPGWNHLFLAFAYPSGAPYPLANGTISMAGWTLGRHGVFQRGQRRVTQLQCLIIQYPCGTDGRLLNTPIRAPILTIDLPRPGGQVSGSMTVTGWARASSADTPAVDAVDIYLDGPMRTGRLLAHMTRFTDRPDVAKQFGSVFLRSGFQVTIPVTDLPAGAHTIYVYAHQPGGGWSGAVARPFTVAAPVDNAAVQWQGLPDGAASDRVEVGTGERTRYLVRLCNAGTTTWTAPAYAPVWSFPHPVSVTGPLLPPIVPGESSISPGQCAGWELTLGPTPLTGPSTGTLQMAHGGKPFGPAARVSIAAQVTALVAPTGLVVTPLDQTEVHITWAPLADALVYELYSPEHGPSPLATFSAQTTSARIGGLPCYGGPTDVRHWSLVAITPRGMTPASAAVAGHAQACPPPTPSPHPTRAPLPTPTRHPTPRPAHTPTPTPSRTAKPSPTRTATPTGARPSPNPKASGTAHPSLTRTATPAGARPSARATASAAPTARPPSPSPTKPPPNTCSVSCPPTPVALTNANVGPRSILLGVDKPTAGTAVSGAITVTGWAIAPDQATGSGVDRVVLYLDGPAGLGTAVAQVSSFTSRPDVAAAHGARYRNSGFTAVIEVSHLPPGTHTIYVYAHNSEAGWSVAQSRQIIVVKPTP